MSLRKNPQPTTPTDPDEAPAKTSHGLRPGAIAIVVVAALFAIVVPFVGRFLAQNPDQSAWEVDLLRDFATAPDWAWSVSSMVAIVFGTVSSIIIGIAIVALVALTTRRAAFVWEIVAVIAVPLIYVTVIKMVVGRARPPLHPLSELPHDFSFPSGHTASATVMTLALILFIRHLVASQRRRDVMIAAIVGAIVIIVATGLSRLVLGVHFPTDVLASAIICPFLGLASSVVVQWITSLRTASK